MTIWSIKRRDFLTLLGGAAAMPMLPPLVAHAQQPAMPVIGFLHQGEAAAYTNMLAAFRRGLRESGYIEGQNIAIEFRWAEAQYDRLPGLAADLVRLRVAVIAASLLPAAEAAKAATNTIPIVFNVGSDPVKTGLVASISRPESNVTGMSRLTAELGPKRLEILRELVPTATTIAFIVNPTNPNAEFITKEAREAARALGLQLPVLNVSNEREIEAAFVTLSELRPGGFLVGGDAFLNDRREQIVALATRHAIPAIYSNLEYAAAGGLMTYGANLTDLDRQFGVYTGRILKGEKPADLPVMQSAKIELIINLKTAKALGLTVPLSLLGRADEVIE